MDLIYDEPRMSLAVGQATDQLSVIDKDRTNKMNVSAPKEEET